MFVGIGSHSISAWNFSNKCEITAGSSQREPPRLVCLKWGDFNFAGSHTWKAEVPPLQSSKPGVFMLA